jgi:hypothetical protein
MDLADIHTITRGEIEHILKCLRFIDRARKTLSDKGRGNEVIVDELRACADGIYGIVRQLPKADD